MTTNNSSSRNNQDENRSQNNKNEGKENRGFAAMPKEKVREIASEGGKASHKNDGNKKDSNRK